MSNSVRPHRWQPTRHPCPWDSPGKNTGMHCHFFLQCMKVKSESEVAQLCRTLSDPMDCSLPGSSIHGIFQAKEHSEDVKGSTNYGPTDHNKQWSMLYFLCLRAKNGFKFYKVVRMKKRKIRKERETKYGQKA